MLYIYICDRQIVFVFISELLIILPYCTLCVLRCVLTPYIICFLFTFIIYTLNMHLYTSKKLFWHLFITPYCNCTMNVFILGIFKILFAVFLLLLILPVFWLAYKFISRITICIGSHTTSMCGNCHLNNQINELPKFNNYIKAELLAFGFLLTLKQLPVMVVASRLTQLLQFLPVVFYSLLQSRQVYYGLFQSPAVIQSPAVPSSH